MKIAKVEALPMYPKVIKEAWVDDEYVWPSQPPSFRDSGSRPRMANTASAR